MAAVKVQTRKQKNQKNPEEWHILDWTTAWVCSEVPDAMLVRAQAASNWREGLREKDEDEAVEVKRSPMIHIKVQHLPVISVQAVDQFRKDARFD